MTDSIRTSSPPALSLRRYGASRGSHAHAHFQVLVGLDGALDLEVEGRGRRIAAGDGWVIEPGDRHDFEARGGARCLVLDTREMPWARAAGRSPLTAQALSLGRYLALCLDRPEGAAVVCLSASQFAQRCRDELGVGAMQWLRQQRLAQARQLRGHGLPVAEVARRTGYRSPSALTAALRRQQSVARPTSAP